jgi:hypothetical protein
MLQVARAARAERLTHLEFMVHSSELMPGGSMTSRNISDIDRLYEHLEILFEQLSSWCFGVTLKAFEARFRKVPDKVKFNGRSGSLPDHSPILA